MKKNTKNRWISIIILFLGFTFMLLVGFYAVSLGKIQHAFLSWHMSFALLIGAFILIATTGIIKEIRDELEKMRDEIISNRKNNNSVEK